MDRPDVVKNTVVESEAHEDGQVDSEVEEYYDEGTDSVEVAEKEDLTTVKDYFDENGAYVEEKRDQDGNLLRKKIVQRGNGFESVTIMGTGRINLRPGNIGQLLNQLIGAQGGQPQVGGLQGQQRQMVQDPFQEMFEQMNEAIQEIQKDRERRLEQAANGELSEAEHHALVKSDELRSQKAQTTADDDGIQDDDLDSDTAQREGSWQTKSEIPPVITGNRKRTKADTSFEFLIQVSILGVILAAVSVVAFLYLCSNPKDKVDTTDSNTFGSTMDKAATIVEVNINGWNQDTPVTPDLNKVKEKQSLRKDQ